MLVKSVKRILWYNMSELCRWWWVVVPAPRAHSNRTINSIKTLSLAMTNADIKWFAFDDPKTKREYFFEPNSKETTWVLPTSKPITSKIDKELPMKHQDHTSRRIDENKMGINNTSSSTKLGWVIMITLVVSLICNTVFLIVLVNLTGPHEEHSNISSIIFANEVDKQEVNESISELISQDDDMFEEDANDVNKEFPNDVIDNAQIPTNEPEECPHEMEGYSYSQPQDAINLENIEKEQARAFQKVATQQSIEYNHQQKPVAVQKNNLPHPNRPVIPPECWVPFAYVFNRACRRNGHKGLQRPMFDAEKFAGAII